jgi:hypothetical protein
VRRFGALQEAEVIEATQEPESESELQPWKANLDKLKTPADLWSLVGLVPIILTSVTTSITGQVHDDSYIVACIVGAIINVFTNIQMYIDAPMQSKVPNLAAYKFVYGYSAALNVPYAWLLYRLSDIYPESLTWVDIPITTVFTALSLYGVLGAFQGKKELKSVDTTGEKEDFIDQLDITLSGQVVVNTLGGLFIPLAWNICARGTEWWDRVQSLHINEAGLLNLSILVALIGNITGVMSYRVRETEVITDMKVIVPTGLLLNVVLLLIPEILFFSQFESGVSKLAFYWE